MFFQCFIQSLIVHLLFSVCKNGFDKNRQLLGRKGGEQIKIKFGHQKPAYVYDSDDILCVSNSEIFVQ